MGTETVRFAQLLITRRFTMQNLLTLLIAWSSAAHRCASHVLMTLPPMQILDYGHDQEYFYSVAAITRLVFWFPSASTSPTVPVVHLSKRRVDLPFSGHGNGALCTASNHRLFTMQNLLTLLIAWSSAAHWYA